MEQNSVYVYNFSVYGPIRKSFLLGLTGLFCIK